MCRAWLVNSFMRWLHFTLATKVYRFLDKIHVWKWWRCAASSSCEQSFGFPCCHLLNLLCPRPLPAQQAFAWVANVENPLLFKANSTWFGERQVGCVSNVIPSHEVILTRGQAPGLTIPSILKHFCSTGWSHNTGLMHYKGHRGQVR